MVSSIFVSGEIMAVEIVQTTVVAIIIGFASILLLRNIIPELYRQDRRIAQFIYLDLFWVAPFFAVILYERASVSSMALVLGDSIRTTLMYTVLCVLVTLFHFVMSARREKQKGALRIHKGNLIIGNETIDMSIVSANGFILVFLMQLLWTALPLEIFYRGYLITRIAESFGDFAGVLLSSLLYFVAFMDKPIFGNINIILGFLWGYSLIITGSFIPGLVAHIFINTMSYYLSRNIAVSYRL